MENDVLIQPVQPVQVTLTLGENKFDCHMLSLSDTELELSGHEYMDKDSQVSFLSQFFRGKGRISEITFAHYCFTYKMKIDSIQFQPGLLINTRL